MAATEAVTFSIASSYYCPSTYTRPSQPITLHFSISSLLPSIKSPPNSFPLLHVEKSTKKSRFDVYSAVGDVVLEEEEEEKLEKSQDEINHKRKLFVLNLPWSFSVTDIKNLFGECGTVVDVEIIKQKNGKNRGFAFVTMGSGDEAQAVIDKFDTHELSGRIIRVEFAKRFKKPSPPPPVDSTPGETRHKLYLSNLAWKVRSNDLRDFFSAFDPVSAKVVFEGPSGKSAGYGFVSFATKEEAETALSALDGKELLSRPVKLKFSEKNVEESSEAKDEKIEDQTETS